MAAPTAMPTGPPTDPRAASRDRTAAGAHTRRQVVVCKVVAPLGIRDLTGTFAGKTSSHGANRCAGRHPDRPTDRAQSRTSGGTAASTDALGGVVIGQIGRALAGQTRKGERQMPAACVAAILALYADASSSGELRTKVVRLGIRKGTLTQGYLHRA